MERQKSEECAIAKNINTETGKRKSKNSTVEKGKRRVG